MKCRLDLFCSYTPNEFNIDMHESTIVSVYDSKISDTVSLFEEAFYKCKISFSNITCQIVFVELFLNDMSIGYSTKVVKLNNFAQEAVIIFRNDNGDRIEGQPFLLQYDLLKLSVQIQYEDGSYTYCCSDYLLCLSKNIENVENIEDIIVQLLEFDDDKINDWMFFSKGNASNSSGLLEGGWQRNSFKSLRSYILMIKSICKCYEVNFPLFRSEARHVISKRSALRAYDKIRNVTVNDLHWLFQNTEQLTEVTQETALQMYGSYYLPYQMNTEESVKSFDTYENRIILGFLLLVYEHAKYIENQLKQGVVDELKIVSKLQRLEREGFRAPIIAVKRMHIEHKKSLLDILQGAITKIAAQYSKYCEILPCSHAKLSGLPKKMKSFQEIRPYRQVFEQIVKWYQFGEFTLAKENIILNVKTLDKIFEYYCLYKLLFMLKNAGFRESNNETPSKSYEYMPRDSRYENERDVANTYILYRDDLQVTLYYQPVVRADGFDNDITLYRTTTKHAYYTPDFLLKVQTKGLSDCYYIIMDSKYSSRDNIRKYYMDKEIIKYSCQLSDKGQLGQSIKMVWMLQGRIDNAPAVEKYHNSPLAEKYRPEVSYGIISINSKRDVMSTLWKEIALSIDL